jgi:N-methylhydantoinase A
LPGVIGVDVGGTFTDIVLYSEGDRATTTAKVLTTYPSVAIGVREAVRELIDDDMLPSCDLFLHGTTIGLNALLQRRGARIGLLTTRGFRDVLEIRRGARDVLYGLDWKAPKPLIPRRLRLGVTERIRADGMIETALREEDVRDALEVFDREHVECIAVVFINSYANPAHELAAARALRAFGFEGEISLSHQITGEAGEYERTTTTVVDAFCRPRMAEYLGRVQNDLRADGFHGDCLVTRSGGGALTFDEASDRPVETIMAGPAAGAMGCAEICAELALDKAIAADVGGTSFDTCLIVDGRPRTRFEGEVAGMPLQTPWIDIRSIGAGGGSIARVDAGLLHVGPRSAGAEPGPISYGRGGIEPTVTDAAAALGMLGRGELAGGAISLDIEEARLALAGLGRELSLDPDRAAYGVMSIVTAQMANAIRSITIEVGEDPRDATLIAFGGAGPLLGTLLAPELDIKKVVVPTCPGAFSAWGLLVQDVTRSVARTFMTNLSDEGLKATNELVDGLAELLHERSSGSARDDAVWEIALDLRYAGQLYALTVDVPTDNRRIAGAPERIRADFATQYEQVYGHTLPGRVEIVAVRLTARTELPRPTQLSPVAEGSSLEDMVETDVDAFSFKRQQRLPFRQLRRSDLVPGDRLAGPCIVLEDTSTTYVDEGFVIDVEPSGCLVLTNTELE